MSFEKIDKVDISFENCDAVTIPIKEDSDLLSFYCTGVQESIYNGNLNKEYFSHKYAEEMRLEFSDKALKLLSYWSIKWDDHKLTLGDYLKLRDIASIHIYYEGGDTQIYSLYEEENENELGSPNKNQINNFQEGGSCIVEIKKKLDE